MIRYPKPIVLQVDPQERDQNFHSETQNVLKQFRSNMFTIS
jgi:hypothetical protein